MFYSALKATKIYEAIGADGMDMTGMRTQRELRDL